MKERGRQLLAPLADLLVDLGVSPNHLTSVGLLVSLFAGFLFAFGRFRWAALALVLGGLCDMRRPAIT